MRRIINSGIYVFMALFIAVTVLSCRHFPVAIFDVLQYPRKYSGKTLVVKGVVDESTDLFFVKYFVIRDLDSDCRLTVVTGRILPGEGERVRVQGALDEAFKIGDNRMLVLKEKVR